jgi:hypothetical protein
METPVERFRRNAGAEEKFGLKAFDLRQSLGEYHSRQPDKRALARILKPFTRDFTAERRRVKRELKALGQEHSDPLERMCLEKHLEAVN